MQRQLFIVLVLVMSMLGRMQGQAALELNATLDAELFKAGTQSHYYFNEISKELDLEKWHFRPYQANLIGKINWSEEWSTSVRFLLKRRQGVSFDQLNVPLLQLQYSPKKKDYQFSLGRMINPFGNFNSKQLSTQRNFIGLPLAYQYFVNISSRIGFVKGMGDVVKIPINTFPNTWGSNMIYYGGYITGFQYSWDIQPGKLNLEIALANDAALGWGRFSEPLRFGVHSRIGWQPTYFWEQGFSLSHGSFITNSEVATQIHNFQQYRQSLIGTDFRIGWDNLEFAGELIWVHYRTPQFEPDGRLFTDAAAPISLSAFAAYLDVKYRLPFLARAFVAYRIDSLQFGAIPDNSADKWDDNVWRHAVAFGYKVTNFFQVRAYASTQNIAGKDISGQQDVFRFMLTLFY